ncbi:MAG: efflux RND transporter permease subunit, partial [Terriglobia bacterium]|nr:efflux RND transporter permease subunit [Terriglobia bacterium]
MWIVRLALRRPYTFVVLSLLILILGITVILRTPTDIFPNIDIPVVTVIWGYNGLSPEQMADRISSVFERAVTTTVDNIEHIETQTLTGSSISKIYFHPGTNVDAGVAQVTAISQTMLR